MNCRPALFAAAFLAASLAACGADFETATLEELKAAKRPRTTTPSFAVKTTDAHLTGVTPVWKTSFSINATYELYVATEITGTLSGRHVQTTFLYTPEGLPYQRIDVAFATDVAAGPGEQQAERTATGWRVWSPVAVAGTLIESANLTGTWRAEVWVDSATQATAAATMTLN
ncbi:MAG: hypothetical protein ACYC8T_23345 [Myxococcaceae bacterium]